MPKTLEEIIGRGPLPRERVIPGVRTKPTREHWYIEFSSDDGFDSLFFKIVNELDPPAYSKGGAITGGCSLTLPDRRKFHALSFKGDLEGWRKQIFEGAKRLGASIGRIKDEHFVVVGEDDRLIPLSECEVRFY